MSAPAIRVQEKGQVTIPLEIRQKLGIKKGDFVTFVETDDGVVIKPAEVLVLQTLDEMAQVLEEKGVSLDDLVALAQKKRKQRQSQ